MDLKIDNKWTTPWSPTMATEIVASNTPVVANTATVRQYRATRRAPATGNTSCGLYNPRARKKPAQPFRFRFKETNTANKSTVDKIESWPNRSVSMVGNQAASAAATNKLCGEFTYGRLHRSIRTR